MGYRRRDGNDWAATTGPARVPCGVVRRTHWGGPDGVRCGTERHTGVDAWADRTGYGATHWSGRTGQDAPGRTHRAGRTGQDAPGKTHRAGRQDRTHRGRTRRGRTRRAGCTGQETPGKCRSKRRSKRRANVKGTWGGGPYILYFLYMIIYPSKNPCI